MLLEKQVDVWLLSIHFSFLEFYVRDIQNGNMQPQGDPTIERETGPTALVNGSNLLGPVRKLFHY